MKGPKGAMVYRPGLVSRFGMIAGGTGITPMLQIIRAIIRERPRSGGKDTTEVDLIFANVNEEDILLKEDLDALAVEDDKFRVHYVLNNAPEKWNGGVGFVTADMIRVRINGARWRARTDQKFDRQNYPPQPKISKYSFVALHQWLAQ